MQSAGYLQNYEKKNDLIKKHNYNFSTIKCYKKEERRKKKHTKSEKLMELRKQRTLD